MLRQLTKQIITAQENEKAFAREALVQVRKWKLPLRSDSVLTGEPSSSYSPPLKWRANGHSLRTHFSMLLHPESSGIRQAASIAYSATLLSELRTQISSAVRQRVQTHRMESSLWRIGT